jgi:penicillin-binding protein 1A
MAEGKRKAAKPSGSGAAPKPRSRASVTSGDASPPAKARRKPKAGGSGGGRSRAAPLALRAFRWSLILSIWGGLALGALVAWYAYDLPAIDRLEAPARRASVTLVDASGNDIATYGDLYADPVRLAEVPPYLVQAIVATEDRRFFEHAGFDPVALVRAALANLRAGRVRQGGSTLTQQLAKNVFLQPDRTLRRKIQELLLAFWLEANFTKEQIFSLYINRVYLGAGTYGVEAASRAYFGKSARNVDLQEAAVLAGLLKAPTRYSPRRDPEAAKDRARVVLAAMVDAGYIDDATAKRAAAKPLRVAGTAARSRNIRYFTDWALDRVSGYVGHSTADLVVRTTLDPRMQTAAERRVEALLAGPGKARGASQAALVAMTPSGAVRALVGGRDYAESQFNRAVQAQRQPGSAFKFFVYLAAMENGLTPEDRFVDGPLKIGNWQPKNYDGTYDGAMTLREAVARSVNTVAVQVSERVGRDKVIDVARRLGVTSPLVSTPSLALGVTELSLMELTSAYGAVANGGVTVWPHAIVEIRERDGRVLYQRRDGSAKRVIEPQTVREMNDLLRAVVEWGSGKAANPGRPAAGKTGTSQDFRDAWFVGYTGELVTGVWLGNDDSAPMKQVTGGSLPARLWAGFMADALRGTAAGPLAPVRAAPWVNPDSAPAAAPVADGARTARDPDRFSRGD